MFDPVEGVFMLLRPFLFNSLSLNNLAFVLFNAGPQLFDVLVQPVVCSVFQSLMYKGQLTRLEGKMMPAIVDFVVCLLVLFTLI